MSGYSLGTPFKMAYGDVIFLNDHRKFYSNIRVMTYHFQGEYDVLLIDISLKEKT